MKYLDNSQDKVYRKVADRLFELFVVNTVAVAIQKDDGNYKTVKCNFTADLIENMLIGGYSLGTYQQQYFNDKLKWICLDFDCKRIGDIDALKLLKSKYVDRVISYLESIKINYLLEFSGRRGIHVWILFDQIITKNLGFCILRKIIAPIYMEIEEDERYGLDLFPKTKSRKVKNKYGLLVKVPLSKHRSGTYSYFIQKDETKFNAVEDLDCIIEEQYKYLLNVTENSIESIISALNIKDNEDDFVPLFHKQYTICESSINIKDIKKVFLEDYALSRIWKHVSEGALNRLERVIILGIFAHIQGSEQLLFDIFKKQENYVYALTKENISKYKNHYFPITFDYLYQLITNEECPKEKKGISIDEYIFSKLGISYEKTPIGTKKHDNYIVDIIEKEKNYYLYNDEVYHMRIWNDFCSFTNYDHVSLKRYIDSIISGNYKLPDNIEYYVDIRYENNKIRKLISLGAKERVLTTVLVNGMISLLQMDYKSYSYHLNFGVGGDVFFPWISSWTRFKEDVSMYFNFDIFEEYSLIKIDMKEFYNSLYLQIVFSDVLSLDIKEKDKFQNIYRYLNAFNEKIMYATTNNIKGVPQGPAYARVMAEIAMDVLLNHFINVHTSYKTIKIYRYVDDMFIFAPPSCEIKDFLYEFSHYFEGKGMLLNLEKTKVYGKLRCLSTEEKNELEDFQDTNYDLFNLSGREWIDQLGQNSYDEIYLRYINRKKKWDINDANLLLSDSISDEVHERYLKEYYYKIISSQEGRGSMFRKFYNLIFNDVDHLNRFLKKRDYEKIPRNGVNIKSFFGCLYFHLSEIITIVEERIYFENMVVYFNGFELEEAKLVCKIAEIYLEKY